MALCEHSLRHKFALLLLGIFPEEVSMPFFLKFLQLNQLGGGGGEAVQLAKYKMVVRTIVSSNPCTVDLDRAIPK